MRTLHLTFETKAKASRVQTIWEIWFTTSVLAFLFIITLVLFNPSLLNIALTISIACNATASTLVGLFTSEE